MLFQGEKNIGVKTAEEEKAENASEESQNSYSQLTQIYHQQWEKENARQKNINKVQKMPVKQKSRQTFKKSHKKEFENKENKDKKPVRFKKKNKKKNQENEEQNIQDLIAKNNQLKEELSHSRKVCRELAQKLQDNRQRKRIKKEDFEIIQKILNRYV